MTDLPPDNSLGQRIRLRLASAGLLPIAEVPASTRRSAEQQEAFEAARARSAGGTLASELIAWERRQR